MRLSIYTMNDNGSGMQYQTKEEFLRELSLMIDDCITNGGTFFSVEVDTNASCFTYDKENGEYEKTSWGERVL